MLPGSLKMRAVRRARELGISLGELIRLSLDQALSTADRQDTKQDPFFADTATFEGEVPPDTAARHDDYLYEG
jgi:hypothetical protein